MRLTLYAPIIGEYTKRVGPTKLCFLTGKKFKRKEVDKSKLAHSYLGKISSNQMKDRDYAKKIRDLELELQTKTTTLDEERRLMRKINQLAEERRKYIETSIYPECQDVETGEIFHLYPHREKWVDVDVVDYDKPFPLFKNIYGDIFKLVKQISVGGDLKGPAYVNKTSSCFILEPLTGKNQRLVCDDFFYHSISDLLSQITERGFEGLNLPNLDWDLEKYSEYQPFAIQRRKKP